MGTGESDASKGPEGPNGAEGGSGEGDENGRDGAQNAPAASPPPVPPAHARARVERRQPTVELAERISELLAEPHASLVGSCARAGVDYKTVKRWLAAELDERPDCEQFQAIVLAALERERVRDLDDLENRLDALGGPTVAKAGALVNMTTWRHDNRFKRFYQEDDAPKKLAMEHTGANGGAIKTANVSVGRGLSPTVRREIVEGILGVPRALLEAGEKMGELDMSTNEGGDDGDE